MLMQARSWRGLSISAKIRACPEATPIRVSLASTDRPASLEGVPRIRRTRWSVKTITATDLLGTYRDVVARLQHEATVPTADAASNFVDLAQSVEHQELARLTATRLAERARRLQIALTRMADGEYGVCSECGTSIPPKR